MEYTVKQLGKMAGISPRTLRFYDEIGLLKPERHSPSGYRLYGPREVDALQQILFFRTLGLDLGTIAEVMADPGFDRLAALRRHLQALEEKKRGIDRLIDTVRRTIQHEEGKEDMQDHEKFEGFKRQLVEENERKYGKEVREAYGDATVDDSNRHMMNLTQVQYEAMQAIALDIKRKLREAVEDGEAPGSDTARDIALLHKQWLTYTWPKYSKEAHMGLAQMYVDDERFTAYYDDEVKGCAAFLRDAVHAWQAAL